MNSTTTRKVYGEEVIRFFAPKALKHDLQKLAAARNVSMSALLRLVVTEYVKSKK